MLYREFVLKVSDCEKREKIEERFPKDVHYDIINESGDGRFVKYNFPEGINNNLINSFLEEFCKFGVDSFIFQDMIL